MRLHNERSEKTNVLLERFPYRYVQVGKLEMWSLDCRIQNSYTGRYRDMYLCDNEMQLMTAMEIMIIHVGWIPMVFLLM